MAFDDTGDHAVKLALRVGDLALQVLAPGASGGSKALALLSVRARELCEHVGLVQLGPHADEQLVDGALVYGAELYLGEGKALVDTSQIFHVSGKAVERLDDHHLKTTLRSVAHERRDALTAE